MNRFGIQPGDVFGGYRVIEEAGRGGMATVLKVQHLETEEIRALRWSNEAVQKKRTVPTLTD